MSEFSERFGGNAWSLISKPFAFSLTLRQVISAKRRDSGTLEGGFTTDTAITKPIKNKVTQKEVANSGGRLKISDAAFDLPKSELVAVVPTTGDQIIVSSTETWKVLWAIEHVSNTYRVFARR